MKEYEVDVGVQPGCTRKKYDQEKYIGEIPPCGDGCEVEPDNEALPPALPLRRAWRPPKHLSHCRGEQRNPEESSITACSKCGVRPSKAKVRGRP
jgi:hypothetical protein